MDISLPLYSYCNGFFNRNDRKKEAKGSTTPLDESVGDGDSEKKDWMSLGMFQKFQ